MPARFKPSLNKEEEKQRTKDLEKLYKLKYVCRKCGRVYGSDKKDYFQLCPYCSDLGRKAGGRKKDV